jgi:cytochrome P450
LTTIADEAISDFGRDHPALRSDPWNLYRLLRVNRPVFWAPRLKSYVALTYATVSEALKSRDFTVEHPFRASRRVFGPTMLDTDGMAHRQLRQVARQPLGAKSVAEHSGQLQAMAERLVAQLPTDEPVDLIERLAEPLPMMILADLLGLPSASLPVLTAKIRHLVSYLDGANVSLSEVAKHRDDLVALLRRAPLDGPLGAAITEAHGSGLLTDVQATSNLVFLMVAGTASSTCAIANTLLCMLQDPNRLRDVASQRTSAVDTVREALRLHTPVHFIPRFASTPVQLGGVTIAKGYPVQLCLASANRDETRFENPDCWLPHRAESSDNLSFGSGSHGCLGARLGETEVAGLLLLLASRFTAAQAVGPAGTSGWVFRRSASLRGVLSTGTNSGVSWTRHQ